MGTYEIIKNLHSGFRYIVFILVILAIVQSLLGWLGKKPYTSLNHKINLFALISAHTQLLIGIVLYFISPNVKFNSGTMKNEITRYYTVEHWIMMLIAIVLITIGYSRAKKIILPEGKHKTVSLFYLIAFIVIIGALLAGHLKVFGSA